MTDRLRILALLMTLLPALFAPMGLRLSVCFCSQAGAEYVSEATELEELERAACPTCANVNTLASHQDQPSGASCRLERCHKVPLPSSDEEREDPCQVVPDTCSDWRVLEMDATSVDRTKSETIDLDARLLAHVLLASDVEVAPIDLRRWSRRPKLVRPIGRTPGGMPLRV